MAAFESEPRTYGQVAYDAYFNYAHGQSLVTGEKLPLWTEQHEEIHMAWEYAAGAVVWEVRGEKSSLEPRHWLDPRPLSESN